MSKEKFAISFIVVLIVGVSCTYAVLGDRLLTALNFPGVTSAIADHESGDTHDHGEEDHGHDHGEAALPAGWHVDPDDPTPHRDHDHEDDEGDHGHDHGEAALPAGRQANPLVPTPHLDHADGDDHGHGHGDDGRSVQFTAWSNELDIFAEHPYVVTGEPAPFVTHVTYMETGKPRTAGSVTLVIEKEGKRIAHTEEAPKRDGIYIPELVFPEAGEWTLELLVPVEAGELSVALPKTLVHASQEEADRAPDFAAPKGIGYLKEQQWKTPFRIALPEKTVDALAVPESAIMTHDGIPHVFVELAGETFAKRPVKVGSYAKGLAYVDEGLSPEEYVVTLGAASIALATAAEEGVEHSAEGGSGASAHAGEQTPGGAAATVRLTEDQLNRYKIELAKATQGSLSTSMRIPGEIKMNSTRMAHVNSHVSGIVLKVLVNQGDEVEEGTPLALIGSHALGDAKTAYLAAQSRHTLAISTYKREKDLHEQGISAQQDYLTAKQAVAEAEIQIRNARQQLVVFGLSGEAIGKISGEAEESIAVHTVKAPISGTVIGVNVILGQAAQSMSHLFEIADLSTVWADLKLTQNELPRVKNGQAVTVTALNRSGAVTGTINYAAPVLDVETRTGLARVVLDNSTGDFSPGMAVEGRVHVDDAQSTVLVPLSSIQFLGEQPCVFVMTDQGFELREVVSGESDGREIEIVKGLVGNEVVVSQNAFHLKAELENLTSGGQVGHGHTH